MLLGMSVDAVPIGYVESPLTDLADAPRQGDEGAPQAWVVVRPELAPALEGLAPGDPVVVITWLDHARRDVLRTHPRGDVSRAAAGVFATRSPDRPNPIGLHPTRIVSIDGPRLCVEGLEAVDGTPVLDLKPVLSEDAAER
jgi:tRNA-Thr(GGU) m(6)t(6)A37 methyltransferase TsaA